MSLEKIGYLAADDGLDITTAGEGLAHPGGVHIELDRRRAAGQHITLKPGRDVDGKGVEPGIHPSIHLRL